MFSGTVVPNHVEPVLPAVVVMEKRRVESGGVDVNRIRPRSIDRGCGNEEVGGVLGGCLVLVDDGVTKIK